MKFNDITGKVYKKLENEINLQLKPLLTLPHNGYLLKLLLDIIFFRDPNNKSENKTSAWEMVKKYKLSATDLYSITDNLFSALTLTLNSQSTKLHNKKKLIQLTQLIEYGIEYLIPECLFVDLDIKKSPRKLSVLRRNYTGRYNTVCYFCGGLLFKRDNKHFCVRIENRSCYNKRHRLILKTNYIRVLAKNAAYRCTNCNKNSSFNYIFPRKGRQKTLFLFCSDACKWAYLQRQHRANVILKRGNL